MASIYPNVRLGARSGTWSSSVLDELVVKRSTGYEVEALGMESRPSSIVKPESGHHIFYHDLRYVNDP